MLIGDIGAGEGLRYAGVDIEDVDRDGEHCLLLRGELDLAAVPTLEACVRRLCGAAATTSIALDLRGLSYVDSAGLAAIVLTGRLCAKHGYDFTLVRGPRPVQRLFELTGLIDSLPFVDPDTTAR